MKHKMFRSVVFDNRKKQFLLEYRSGLRVECPYSALGIRDLVVSAYPDRESGCHSFCFTLENGRKDYVPYDQPLHIIQHPEYVKQRMMYEMTKKLNGFIEREKIAKRELARRLGTSLSQLARLLDTTNYKKELARLIELATILNYEFQWRFTRDKLKAA